MSYGSTSIGLFLIYFSKLFLSVFILAFTFKVQQERFQLIESFFILDSSHLDARLSVLLNGFELHVYNRSQLYSRLEHLFGLESSIIPSGTEPYWQDSGGDCDTQIPPDKPIEDQIFHQWRDLTHVIKAEISTVSFFVV